MAHTVIISYSDKGTYVASSAKAPYFCFEAPTEEEASELACRALNFYHEVSGEIIRKPSEARTLVRSRYKGSRVFNEDTVV